MEQGIPIGMEEQKRIQLDILKELKYVCDKNNIDYSLGGGTLLGAIRHKGYIPWDDDIDIMLMRSEYEKLLNIFNNESRKKEYKLISYKNTTNYYYPFAKIVNVKTRLIEDSYRDLEEMGIYIDIFPIDYLPNEEQKVKKIYKKYKLENKLLGIYKYNKDSTANKKKMYLKKVIRFFLVKLKIYKLILSSIDNLCKKYVKTNKVACISGRYFEKEIMPSEYISDYVQVDFEGESYKAAKGYDEYLTKHYGNYMELPPKEKQISNHNNIAFWKI